MEGIVILSILLFYFDNLGLKPKFVFLVRAEHHLWWIIEFVFEVQESDLINWKDMTANKIETEKNISKFT